MIVWRWAGWRLNQSTKEEVQGIAKRWDLRGISGRFGAAMGVLWPWLCDVPILDLDEVGETKKPLYVRIFF